jgi:hypothetical protein
MKRALTIFVGGLLLAATAYCGFYLSGSATERNLARSRTPELAWLKQEFHLDDAEFQRISQLHAAYQAHCAEMCRRIAAKNSELQALLAANDTVTPEIKMNLSEAARIRADCQAAMLAHFCEVSRTMPPAEGKRYLAWVCNQTLGAMQNMPDMPAPPAHDTGHH